MGLRYNREKMSFLQKYIDIIPNKRYNIRI